MWCDFRRRLTLPLILPVLFSAVAGGFGTACAAGPDLRLGPVNPAFSEHFKSLEHTAPAGSESFQSGCAPPPIPPRKRTREEALADLSALPAKYDMRDPNADGNRADSLLTPVRTQGNCGSGWAFAAYGSLESSFRKLFGVRPDFSEDNLRQLHGFGYGPCEGGNIFMTLAYLSRYDGPVREMDDPYDPAPDSEYCVYCSPARYMNNLVILPVRADALDNAYIKQAILDHGGIYTSMFWNDSSYNPAERGYRYDGNATTGNHAVVVVGWDDDRVVSNAPGKGAFLVRDSRGRKWGDGGYFHVSYYDKFIAFENVAYFEPVRAPFFDMVYCHDKLGITAVSGYGSEVGWAANRFTMERDGWLRAVGFYATAPKTAYEAHIYSAFDGTAFGDRMGGTSGIVSQEGWYTVRLAKQVFLKKGEEFSVAIEFRTPGNRFPIPLEKPDSYGYASSAVASRGQSYVSPNGVAWTDVTKRYRNTNVCIKALVKNKRVAGATASDALVSE